jgi:hypothetical protein
VVASLIIRALVVYDLQRARGSDGHFEWRDLFKGTTPAQSVPFVSAMAVALFSALSPLFMHEITNSVATLQSQAQAQSQIPRAPNQEGN